MAIQAINVGSSANDGTGDDLRSGAVKINANFTELSGAVGSLETDVSAAETSIETINTSITAIETDVTAAESAIAVLEARPLGTYNAPAADSINAKLDANILRIAKNFGADMDNLPTAVTRNRSHAFIYGTPMPFKTVITSMYAVGEFSWSNLTLYALTLTDGVFSEKSSIVIDVGIGVHSEDTYISLEAGEYLGVGMGGLSNWNNGSGIIFTSLEGELQLGNTGLAWVFDRATPILPYTPSDADNPNAAMTGAIALVMEQLDLKTVITNYGIPSDDDLTSLAAREQFTDFPMYEYENDTLFSALDAAGGTGAHINSLPSLMLNKPIPVTGYIDKIRVSYGNYGNTMRSLKVLQPTSDGKHSIVSDTDVWLDDTYGTKIITLPEPIFVKKGQRISFAGGGFRSVFGSEMDNSGGTHGGVSGFDPTVNVWNETTLDSRRIYGFGINVRAMDYDPAATLKNNMAYPESIVMRGCGQSNDETIIASPIDELINSSYSQTSTARATSNGGFNGGGLSVKGPAAGFFNHARAISKDRIGYGVDMWYVDGSNGGTALTGLMAGTAPFIEGTAALQKVAGVEYNKSRVVNVFTQGENDQSDSLVRATYTSNMITLAKQLQAAEPSDYPSIPMLALQCTSKFATPVKGIYHVAGAQLDATHSPEVVCIGPSYGHVGIGGMQNQNQGAHYSEHTIGIIGAMYAWTAYELMAGRNYEPLHVSSVSVMGNDIILNLNKRNVVIDTTIIPSQTNYGMEVYDSGYNAKTVNSVTLLSGGRIKIALNAAPASGDIVRVGALIASTTGLTMQPYSGGASNFRTSQPLFNTVDDGTYGPDPVHEWLCIEEITL